MYNDPLINELNEPKKNFGVWLAIVTILASFVMFFVMIGLSTWLFTVKT